MARVLLIHPPFALPDKPYLSLPVLGAWLRGQGHQVHYLDANLEMFRRLLAPGELAASGRWLIKRLLELDAEPLLDEAMGLEYLHLRRAALEAEKLLSGQMALPVFHQESGWGFGKRVELFRQACLVAGAPHHPARLDFQGDQAQPRLFGEFSPYSLADLLAGREQDSFFGPHYARIVNEALEDARPQMVGITAPFPDQLIPALAAARWVKQFHSQTLVVLGGSMVSCYLRRPPNAALFNWLDGLVADDGEIALAALAKESVRSRPDLTQVPGLIFRQGGIVAYNPPALALPLAKLPPADFSGLPLGQYLPARPDTALPFRLSRGCAWAKCAFCNTGLACINHRDQKTADQAHAEISALHQDTGLNIIHLTDDSASPLLLDQWSHLLVERGPRLRWVASLRFDRQLTLERCLLLRRAGLRAAYLGLESACPRVLRLMKKGISLKLVEQVLFNLSFAGIMPVLYMMVGFPGETEAEARESFGRVLAWRDKGLAHAAQYSLFELSPFSEVNADPEAYGVRGIRRDPRLDLGPPAGQFQAPGMSRQKAASLHREFTRALRPEGLLQAPPDPQLIRLQGRTMRLKHPVRELQDRIRSRERGED